MMTAVSLELALTTESLMFAAVVFAASALGRRESIGTWILPPKALAWLGAAALSASAVTAAIAWSSRYGAASDLSFADQVSFWSVLSVVVAQPVIAIVLVRGLDV